MRCLSEVRFPGWMFTNNSLSLHFFYNNRSWHADVGDRDVPAIEVTVYMAMTQYAIWRRLK